MTGYPILGPALLALGTCIAAYILTGVAIVVLRRKQILDHPNLRSSHTRPTPRGGGWGIVGAVLPVWAGLAWLTGSFGRTAPILLAAGALVAVSWIDDRRSLNPLVRLTVQFACATAGLFAFETDRLVFQGLLPLVLDRAAAVFCWVWFMNLYNFMDGIDGLAAAEAVAIGIGVVLVTAIAGLSGLDLYAAALLGSAAGFLVWNWQPARVFMGDVGSVPLGFMIGWLLLTLAGAGLWGAALLLPLYFVADATLTLLRRAFRRERVWQAHREHLYQRAVAAGRSHGAVTSAAIAVNAVLVVAAVWSMAVGWPAVAAGAVAVALFLMWLARPA